MEEKKALTGKILIVVIVILLVAIAGLLAYIVVQNNNTKNNTASQGSVTNVTGVESNASVNSVMNNSYALYQQNYNKMFNNSFSIDENGNLYDWVVYVYNNPSDVNGGISDAYVDSHGDAYIDIAETSSLYSKYGTNYKVASNVADVAFCHYANGLTYYLALVNQDGTVSVIVLSDDTSRMSEIKVTNIPNVNNIVKVIYQRYGNGWFGTAIDVNGNTISLDQYIAQMI